MRRGRKPPVPQTDQDQKRLYQQERLVETAQCRYFEGLGKVDASGAELEPYVVAAEHPL